eukprot:TRINITY_DN9863_c1_g1_i1.p1 TRINITY_DN9863_c1_g1~~TRINITY_DN9863_c1_g1_i1.p1  ORF type:complete len:1235 (+),score=276.02 TRINITY_DN9863_c1_g1_i1:91-3705(+)
MASAGEGEVLAGDEALAAAADYVYKALKANEQMSKFVAALNVEKLAGELRNFLSKAFEDGFPPMEIGSESELLSTDALEGLVEVLMEGMKKPLPLGEDALCAALAMLSNQYLDDERVTRVFEELQQAEVEDYVQDENVPGEEMEEQGGRSSGAASGAEVNTASLEDMIMPAKQAEETKSVWQSFLNSYPTRELAGEAIYAALFDSAPSLQSLFKTPRAVMSLRFMMGINSIIMALGDGKQVKGLIEALGFQHLDLEVTVPRVAIFRDAICDLMSAEMGSKLTSLAADGLIKTLNYSGGGYIYIREKFSERLKILSSSWRTASGEEKDELELAAAAAEAEEDAEKAGEGEGEEAAEDLGGVEKMSGSGEDAEKKQQQLMQGVPTTFDEMFRFNAAVMGLSNNAWMYEILDSFDAIVRNIANSYRLQEECDVLALRMAKLKSKTPPKLAEYKAVMLASLRSLVPKDWDTNHEAAWNWLWENVERMLEKELGKPAGRERYLGRFLGSLEEDTKQVIRQEVYKKFFVLAPAGQDYFKQSTTRLYFIADKILEMILDMYKEPRRMVDDVSALGLRHVGYGIPTEFFSPFVTGCIEVVRELTSDEKLCDAFGWSLGLVSRLLVRTITEGSTIVMKAINTDSKKQVVKSISCAPRGKRSVWMLNVTVGTQSISPLIWAISSGSLEAAQCMLKDLLTIRADRDRYYYGSDELFSRHPDIVEIITVEAPALVPTLLDGMVWRSRIAVNGYRRANFYIKHLLVDSEGGFADAMSWISKLRDPGIVTHSVLMKLTDIVWNSVIYRPFLLSKVWLLFTLLVFLFSQSILRNLVGPEGSHEERVATFACRIFVYMASMVELVYSRTKYACKAIKDGDLVQVGQFPVPRRYVEDWQEVVSLLLTLILIAMFVSEPILYCLQHGEGDFPGAGLFTQNCEQAAGVRGVYEIMTMIAMIFYFALLIDFSALSTRLSAFVLLTGRVTPEFALTLVAAGYMIVSFSTSITTTNEKNKDFGGIPKAALSLLEMSIRMYSGSKFEELGESPWTLLQCIGFVIVVVVFFFNVLIAQLSCAYQQVYKDMVGYARLNRMDIIVDTMPGISKRRWNRFVEGLRFEEKLEFGEGDVGLPGGVQILEPSHLFPTNIDSIKRFGGSTSPGMPWPEEEDEEGGEGDKFERLTKSVQMLIKKASSQAGRGKSQGSTSSGGDPKSTSEEVSMVSD